MKIIDISDDGKIVETNLHLISMLKNAPYEKEKISTAEKMAVRNWKKSQRERPWKL